MATRQCPLARCPLADVHSLDALGSEVRDPGSGIWDLGSGIWSLGSGIRDLGSGIRDAGSGVRDPGSGIRDPGSGICDLVSGIWDLGSGIWNLGPRIWDLESGTWDLGSRDLGIWGGVDVGCKVNGTDARGLIVSELQSGGWENCLNLGLGPWIWDVGSGVDLGSGLWV